MPDDAAALAAFGYELGVLKRVRRYGWNVNYTGSLSMGFLTMRRQESNEDRQSG